MTPSPIIISGMHRSGTSLLAAYLEECGVHIGNDLLEGDKQNAKGYFEQRSVLEFQRQLLISSIDKKTALFPDWGVGTLELAKNIDDQLIKDAIASSKEHEFEGPWGWKDPRSCLLSEVWDKAFPSAKYLLIYREPWEVFRSIDAIDHEVFRKNPELARAAWLQYNRAVLKIKAEHGNDCILIGTRGLLRNPSALIDLVNERWNAGLRAADMDDLYSGQLMDRSINAEYFEAAMADEEISNMIEDLDASADLPNNPSKIEDVSVVITCYNDGRYLKEAIHSVERSMQKVPLVIVNDGSTDPETLELLERLKAQGYNIFNQKNKGLPAARNSGFIEVNTDFVLPLDADNRIDPFYLCESVKELKTNNKAAFAYSDKRDFESRHGTIRPEQVSDLDLLIGNRIDACAVIRKSAWEEVGGYNEELIDGYEDWDLWLSFIEQGFERIYIPQILFDYRVRKGSLLSKADDPETRRTIVGHIVAGHEVLFAADLKEVLAGLHAVQAHDKHVLIRSLKELEQRLVIEKEQAVAKGEERLAEIEALSEDRRAHLEQAEKRLDEIQRQIIEQERSLFEEKEHGKRIEEELQEINAQNAELSTETFRLVQELDKSQEALQQQREYGNALIAQAQQLDQRIKEMEATKVWRLRVQYHKMRTVLRTSGGRTTKGFKWIRKLAFVVSKKGRRLLRKFFAKVFKVLYLWTEDKPVQIIIKGADMPMEQFHQDPYYTWMARNMARESDLAEYRDQVENFSYRPKFSIIMPVYNPPIEFFEQAVQSVIDQVYENWELCIADDLSTDPKIRETLEAFMEQDDRIKVVYREENGHISKASNSALEIASGEFAVLMDHDDLITRDALYHNVKLLNKDKELDVIYSDEDKVDEGAHFSDPHFKPQWCPDHLLSRNYFGHLVVLRMSILKEIKGFRVGFEGSQDYDLMLRYTERTERIAHIPKVLYRWRIHSGSAAQSEEAKPYAYDAARKALTEALERRGEPGKVDFLPGFRGYSIRFNVEQPPKVSILIPTKDEAEVLKICLTSIFEKTDYPDLEVIVVSNNSEEKETFELLKHFERVEDQRFKWFELNEEFNFAKLMNVAVEKSDGAHLLFLNNDTEVIEADWVQAMVEQSQRGSIGAVGVKLLYHNDTIQHAGVLIGLGGAAGHTFVGYHKDEPGYFNYINTINNYSAVTAACMMVAREKFEEVGGYDEKLAVEYNDVDLCLRLRESGLNNVYLPHVPIYHYESLSRGHPHLTKASYERHLREIKIFQNRWQKYIDDDPCYNPNLSRGVHDFQIQL